ncbi:hypothetical protein [Streptomyces sp. NBC_01244]|uniref:hypothetical protein n=1 Tax=Streptomyces sp. NBC_01244 TaxID=2903797 RepID=UPI002E0F926F|nr:hypothetical protein OG247_43660 [Streptomyces sp. NBC_01244]
MSPSQSKDQSPIYNRLIQERGDVLAETRAVAEQVLRQAQQALDWSAVRPGWQPGERAGTFSAFG